MRRPLGIIVISLLFVAGAQADPDAITLAGRPYLRWQFDPSGVASSREGGVVVRVNEATLFSHAGPFATEYARVRSLDSWVRDRYESKTIDESLAVRCWGMKCARTSTHSIFMWERNSEAPPVYLRAFDNATGAPVGPSVPLSNQNDEVINQAWDVDTNSGFTVACYYGYLGGALGPFGLVFQRLNQDGSLIGARHTVYLSPFQSGFLSVRPDGSFIVRYLRVPISGPTTEHEVHVMPDDTVLPEHSVPNPAWREIEQIDGTYLQVGVAVNAPGDPSYVRRVDIGNQELSLPEYIIPANCVAVGGTRDGRFATLHANGGTNMRLQLYDSAWRPIGAPELFIRPELTGIYSTSLPSQAIGYATDGTIWVVWRSGSNARVTVLRPFTPGDLDGDGIVTNFDIDPFVLALVDPAAYQATYNLPADALGDFDGDGHLTNFDIDPFVDALLHLDGP